MDQSFNLTTDSPEKLISILNDMRKAKKKGYISIDDDGQLYVGGHSNFRIGGVFHTWVKRHESVQRAIEDKDPEFELWARQNVTRQGLAQSQRGYVEIEQSDDHNKIPFDGIDFILELILYPSTAKITQWWHGPFTSNWTPVDGALSDWSKVAGGLATELTALQYGVSVRKQAYFNNVASSQSISHSAVTAITIAAGYSGITMYGSTINEISTIAYASQDKILLAATTFGSPKSGLGETDVINLGYTLGGTDA